MKSHRLAVFALLLGLTLRSHAAVEVNTASEAELDGVRGLGPATSQRILQERQQARFQNWEDLMRRVRGLAPRAAARLSEAGLVVNGLRYPPPPPDAATPAH